jgi:hypothetical protein
LRSAQQLSAVPGKLRQQGTTGRRDTPRLGRRLHPRGGEKRPLPACQERQAYRKAAQETKCSHASAMRFQHPLWTIIGGGLSGIQWILSCETRSFRD